MAARLPGFPQCWHSFAPGLVRVVAAAQSAGLHVHCRGPDLLVRECLVLLPPPGVCPEAALQLLLAGLPQLLLLEEMPGPARLPLAGRRSRLAE